MGYGCRVMVALWVPSDDINSGAGAAESPICDGAAGLGGWSHVACLGRPCYFLFLQSPIFGS